MYLDLVKNTDYPDMRLLIGDDPVFMQDGASSHAAKVLTEYLGNNFEVLEPWPASRPDLNVRHCAIWAITQAGAQKLNPHTEIDLKVAIRRAASALSPELVGKCVDEFPKRAGRCIECGGANFEYKM